MSNYFNLVSAELIGKLAQIRSYITKHNPTIGILTEEILRSFLSNHLPKAISVEQGFIINKEGAISRQCDILIYDSHNYSPFYRVNDIVVVPVESVLAVIEVKTTINRSIFHKTIDYFRALADIGQFRTYLFIFNSSPIHKIGDHFHSYRHPGGYQSFDHDTFQFLPDSITGLNSSFYLTKSAVVFDRDMIGYLSWFYKDEEGTDINALQQFYLSIYDLVETYICKSCSDISVHSRASYHNMSTTSISAIELFPM